MFIDFKHLSSKEKLLLKNAIEECGVSLGKTSELIPFSNRIPLDSSYVMETFFLDGTFQILTPKNRPIPGGNCTLRLISENNGAPNFDGMFQVPTSYEFDTTGLVNLVTIWFDGTQILYRIDNLGTYARRYPASAQVNLTNRKIINIDMIGPLSSFPIPETDNFILMVDGKRDFVSLIEINDEQLIVVANNIIPIEAEATLSYLGSENNPLFDRRGYEILPFSNLTINTALAE